MYKRVTYLTIPALCLLFAVACAGPKARITVVKKDDLPRHVYQLNIPAATLYDAENRSVLMALAAQLRKDIESDLAIYHIQDASTLQDLYADLGSVALLEGRWQAYLDLLDMRRALERKEANKLSMSLVAEAIARAKLEGAADQTAAVRTRLEARLAELPYELVQDNLKSSKGRSEILSRALVLGSIESGVQPVLDKTGGEMSYDLASRLVGTSFTMDHYLAAAPMINQVYSAIIAANKVEKVDIWEQRKVNLNADNGASPVVISVWDSGVDTDIFAASGQLWENKNERAGNNEDDDGNGFIDDIHGIAYSLHADQETSLLYPTADFGNDEITLQSQVKGLGDISSSVESDEATALRKTLAALKQEEVKDFIESIGLYGNYSHGTHVAGIALEGNPYARLLVARITFGHEMIPEKPTVEQELKSNAATLATVDYFKTNGVRAVNMSWGGDLRSFEEALEAHNVGDTPEARKSLARELYNIGDRGLRQAIADTPEILYIVAAGNSDNDVKFDESYPSGYDYPNMISVGAVDIEGKETSFTSLGKVDIYANGFEVESYVPGGKRIAYNGTSMASPQVLNLAGKLLAVDPSLTTAQLRQLILDGADVVPLAERDIKLMNPKRSMELLNAKK